MTAIADMPAIGLNHLADFRVIVSAPQIVGETGRGERRVVAITGGTVTGARLRGTIRPGGSDDQLIGTDGVPQIHARYLIEADDGVLIYMDSHGLRLAAENGYFVTALRFESDAPAHRWLCRRFFIARGERRADRVALSVHEVV